MNFELLFTKEVIAVALATAAVNVGYERTDRVSFLQRSSSPLDNLQTTRDQCWTIRLSIYDQSSEAQLRVNIYCIFLFQMGGYLECIRYCIYDSIAAYGLTETQNLFVPQSSRSFTQNPTPFLCVTSRHICSVR